MGYTPTYDARSLSVHIGTVGGGAMTAGSANLGPVGFTPLPGHETAQYFTVADVGRIVTVFGAGPSGSILIAKIASYVDTQNVVLTVAASTSVAGDQSNVTVYRPCSIMRGELGHSTSLTSRDSARFTVRSLDGTFIPIEGQPVLFVSTDPAVGIYEYGVFFGGSIDSVRVQNYGADTMLTSECDCISWENLAVKRVMMGRKYLGKTAGYMFTDIIQSGLIGDFIGVNTVTGPTVPELTIDDYTVVSDALDRVAQTISNAVDVYYWKSDPFRRYTLALQTATTAPWSIDQSTGSDNNILPSISATRTREKYANHAYLEASQRLLPAQTYTVKIGTTPVAPPPGFHSRSITLPAVPAVMPSMTLDGTPLVILPSGDDPRIDGSATNPTGADWVWLVGTDRIWTDLSHPGLTVGHTIVVTYQTAEAGHSFYENGPGVAQRSAIEGGSGYYETITNVDRPLSQDELDDLAESVANRFGAVPTIVDIETLRPGLRVGQELTINRREVAGTFVISSAEMSVQDGQPRWSITATNGSVIGDWRSALAAALGGSVSVAGGGGGGVRLGAPPLPLALTAALPSGTVGVAYSGPLIATGGTAPYAFSISDGALPAWATLDVETGVITGTPTTAATTAFTARVTDSASLTQDFACSLVIVAASSGAVAPGDVTITSITVDAQPTTGSSVQGSRNAFGTRRGFSITYDPPSPVGVFQGVYVQIEAPDQTLAYSTRGGRPGRYLDGSVALDSLDLSGPRAPEAFGPFAHADTDGSLRVFIPEPDAAQLPMNARVRLISYSEAIKNAAETAPSQVAVIPAAGASKPSAGTAYAHNPVRVLIPTTVPGSGVRGSAQANPYRTVVSGVDETHLWVTIDLDPRAYGYQLILINPDGDHLNASGIETAPHFQMVFNTPGEVGTYTLYACGSDGTNINPIVDGITPSVTVTLGTDSGTVHLGRVIPASVGSGLAVTEDGVGVPDGGITEALLDTFAVSAAKIADGAVETAKIADLSIVTSKLAASAVNASKLADLAVEAAKLADSSVTATKIAAAAVGTAAIANLAVGNAHIQNGAITNAKIGNLAVSTTQIQDAAITNAKIGNLAVSTTQIQDAAITNAKIDTIAANKITAGTISAAVSMTSPSLTVTSGALTINIDAANYIKVTDTSASSYAQMTTGYFYVSSTSIGGANADLKVDNANQYGCVILRSPSFNSLTMTPATSSSASAGGTILPSNPTGFLVWKIGTFTVKIPYYSN